MVLSVTYITLLLQLAWEDKLQEFDIDLKIPTASSNVSPLIVMWQRISSYPSYIWYMQRGQLSMPRFIFFLKAVVYSTQQLLQQMTPFQYKIV